MPGVAGVHYVATEVARSNPWRAGSVMTQNECGEAERVEIAQRVGQRLTLGHRRGLRVKDIRLSTETTRSYLERQSRPRRRLGEQKRHVVAAQRRSRVTAAIEDVAHLGCGGQDRFDLLGRKLLNVEQVALGPAHQTASAIPVAPLARSITTSSAPSVSER